MYNNKYSNMGILVSFLAFILIFSHAGIAQHEHMHDEHPLPEGANIGDIDFRVDCDEGVREDFDHALGMLHHMMYVISRGAFEEIAERDTQCAMAYWGIATTLFQPLWGTRPSEEELQRGWQKIQKARDLVQSEREKLLIESTAGFFKEPETADFWTRIERWVDGVETAYNAYPDDLDIAALYGLTLLTKAQRADDRDPLFDEAEKVLREVFEQVSTHPGAIHYTIHATDVDGRAENALDMVEAYGKIAPEVPHALHMPSHIYVRLGNWPEVIDWNIASENAALNHPANGATSHHYIHAIDYLVYAYLQRGEDNKARAVIEEAWEKEKHQPTFISAFHFAAIPARMAVENREWEQAAAIEPRTPEYLPWDASQWAEGLSWFARGLGRVHTGDIEGAQKAEQRLKELRDVANERGDKAMATYLEIDRRVLAGRIAYAKDNAERAVELTRSAAELEGTIEKHPVTPGAILPPYEALGDLLTDLGRPAEAFEAYEASDAIWPGRYNTLLGAARSAREAGKDHAANTYYEKLLYITGDTDRPAISEAQEFINQ